jgi:hypothetical protein
LRYSDKDTFYTISFLSVSPLHTQFHPLARTNSVLKLLTRKGRLNPFLQESIDLLRSPTNEARRVQQRIKVRLDRLKVRISSNTIKQIVLEAKLLDLVSSFMGENLDVSQLTDDQ